MCGINGIVHFDGAPVDEQRLVTMRDVMLSRGPDVAGIYLGPGVGLGHRRLKIIDLSRNADQPIPNEDGTVHLVFNGEIYNFPELREQLAARGHIFRSHSDTEVIVHGYEEWGEAVVARLDGAFSFGLWDSRREMLLLARDRFGKKPLFYRRIPQGVEFSQDIKSFWLVDRGVTVNPAAIDCYLFHLAVPQAHAIFNEIAKVQPAHYRVFTKHGSREVRYWAMDFGIKVERTEDDTVDLLEQGLRQAIRRRLISDVPLGAFLSGGIDSSLVVALMSDCSARPVKTFSIGFREQDYSELKYSRQVAERYGTDHSEILLEPRVLDILPALVWEYGEPFADSSAVPSYYVSEAARAHVTVALTGDGGDEMFGGYGIARAAYFASIYERVCPVPLRRTLEHAVLSGTLTDRHPALHKLKTMMVAAHPVPAIRHSYSMAFDHAQKSALYEEPWFQSLNGHRDTHLYEMQGDRIAHWNLVDQHLFLTIVTRLANDYLVKLDVASMTNSIELRSPFLDTSLCEFSCTIAPRLKVRAGTQKYLLKRLAARHLPHQVIHRRKQGFSLPLEHWLRTELQPVLRHCLPAGSTVQAGWFKGEYVQRLIDEHVVGQKDHTHRLWSLLWLELWYRMFVDRTLKPHDDLSV